MQKALNACTEESAIPEQPNPSCPAYGRSVAPSRPSCSSFTMGLSDFFSSFIPTVYADAPEEKEEKDAPAEEPTEEPAAAEEEEEVEPEDVRA